MCDLRRCLAAISAATLHQDTFSLAFPSRRLRAVAASSRMVRSRGCCNGRAGAGDFEGHVARVLWMARKAGWRTHGTRMCALGGMDRCRCVADASLAVAAASMVAGAIRTARCAAHPPGRALRQIGGSFICWRPLTWCVGQ